MVKISFSWHSMSSTFGHLPRSCRRVGVYKPGTLTKYFRIDYDSYHRRQNGIWLPVPSGDFQPKIIKLVRIRRNNQNDWRNDELLTTIEEVCLSSLLSSYFQPNGEAQTFQIIIRKHYPSWLIEQMAIGDFVILHVTVIEQEMLAGENVVGVAGQS